MENYLFSDGSPLHLIYFKTRIGRKTSVKRFYETAPVSILVYDLLEYEGKDIRERFHLLKRKKSF